MFCVLGVHQVALLTHIDQVCVETAKDLTHVYKSAHIQAAVGSRDTGKTACALRFTQIKLWSEHKHRLQVVAD